MEKTKFGEDKNLVKNFIDKKPANCLLEIKPIITGNCEINPFC